MKSLRSIACAVILAAQLAPAFANFRHGAGPPLGLAKTVLNMNFGGDQFMNLAAGFGTMVFAGTATPANLTQTGFPSGVLPANISSGQSGLPGGYYGHYTLVSTGISAMEWGGTSIIVYSGGQQVYPDLSSGFGTSGPNTTFIQNGAWNVEFSFGDTIVTVQNSTTTPGLVEIVSSDANGFLNIANGATVQVHNVSNLSATTVWTINKINNTTVDLQGSTWSASMVPATGNPGTAAELIYNPGSVTPSWLSSVPTFGTPTHTISSLIFCKTADLAAVQSGKNISTAAINFITTLNPKWLRFMDMIGVQAVSGQFQYLPDLTYLTKGSSQQWQPNYFGGTSTSTGDAYTVSPGPSSPTSGPINDGEVIEFVADHTSGLLPTLAITGRSGGAKPILRNGEGYLFYNLAASASSPAITSITGNGTTATVTTTAAHGFTTGQLFIVNISGNTPSTFNATNALATATGASTFTYSNSTNGSTSAAGTFNAQLADQDVINLTFTASNFSGGVYTSKYYVNLATAAFSGTTSGTTLTVTGTVTGHITPGQRITGASLSNSPIVLPYGSGGTTGAGGTGTYALDVAPTGTTTITGATGQCGGAGGGNGPLTSMSSLSADLFCVMQSDPTLGGQQVVFSNNGGVGLQVFYAPAVAQITPSVTITQAGGAAEVVTPSYGGNLVSGTIYTAQYRPHAGGWITTPGALFVGIPIGIMKEYAQRTGAGIWYNISMAWSQASATSFGTYLAQNLPGIPIHIEVENELWNTGQNPNHTAQAIGVSLGFTGVTGSLYFQSVYDTLGWSIENLSKTIVTSYVAAGGNRNNIFVGAIFSEADGQGCSVTTGGCAGGQTGGVQIGLLGPRLTPTPASFTGTINPATNGHGATLTVTGISGALFSGYQINGTGVTAGTHIASCAPAASQCFGNGTYQLDTSYGSTVGPIAMTATNVVYSAVGGPGATSTSADYTAFPNRPVDVSDNLGYATYWNGALAGEGSGSWFGASPTPYAALLQASANYAQGVATSNNSLIQSALNAWSADTNGLAVANTFDSTGNYSNQTQCGFLASTTATTICLNAPNVVITGSTGGTSTLTITAVTGTITPGMELAIPGGGSTPVILPYGTNGTTGTGGTGTYALSRVYSGPAPNNSTIGIPTGAVQGFENIAKAFDGARPSGRPNLGILQYEGALTTAFCAGGCPVGNIFLSTDPTTLAAQFTSNGWNLDPTYGYPGFGSGNLQTATNVVTLYLAYVNSQQYYNDALYMYNSEKTINADRPFFGPAQYGIEGTPGQTATTGAPQWGMLPGDLSTTPLQNYNAQSYFNTH